MEKAQLKTNVFFAAVGSRTNTPALDELMVADFDGSELAAIKMAGHDYGEALRSTRPDGSLPLVDVVFCAEPLTVEDL